MERLGDIVARVLANVRVTMEEEKAGGRDYSCHASSSELAEAGGGGKAPRLARGEAHRSSHRTAVKTAKTAALTTAVRR